MIHVGAHLDSNCSPNGFLDGSHVDSGKIPMGPQWVANGIRFGFQWDANVILLVIPVGCNWDGNGLPT